MRVNPYLLFNGSCREAFTFYAECLGGKIQAMLTHGGTPAEAHVPAEWRDKILHASLTVGEDVIMGSDAPPGHFEPPQGFSVTIQLADPAEAERVFQRLSAGATVKMPMQTTFWATRFGMLVDRFGTPWMVNCQPNG